jgi:hypothetical protein
VAPIGTRIPKLWGATSLRRILFLDANLRFLNATRDLIPRALALCGEFVCYGPGFQSPEVLKRGTLDFIAKNGPFDLVVSTPHVIFASGLAGKSTADLARLYRRAYAFKFSPADLGALAEMNAAVKKVRPPRVSILLEMDYYNFDADRIEKIKSVSDYIVGFGPGMWVKKAAMPDLYRETFASRATDRWADFLQERGSSVASMHHFVDIEESSDKLLGARTNGWAVLGVKYAARADVIKELGRRNVNIDTITRKLIGGAKRIGLLRNETEFAIAYLQSSFRSKLTNSRYAFTCGSGLNMPVRKFFEIPAAGAVLVCKPFNGFNDAGFRHGDNCVVSEPSDIVDTHRWLEAEPDRAQRIADAGRNLIIEQHSVVARARQFAETIAAVVDGSFAGGRWSNGEYGVVRKAPPTLVASPGLTTQ